jgi:hypothetical protein
LHKVIISISGFFALKIFFNPFQGLKVGEEIPRDDAICFAWCADGWVFETADLNFGWESLLCKALAALSPANPTAQFLKSLLRLALS